MSKNISTICPANLESRGKGPGSVGRVTHIFMNETLKNDKYQSRSCLSAQDVTTGKLWMCFA